MTNEEAIAYANDWLKDEYALCEDDKEVLRMAIEALKQVTGKLNNPDDTLLTEHNKDLKEQKSKLDLISRKDVLNMIIVAGECEPDLGYTHLHDVIKSLPSAEPKTGKWVEHKWAEEVGGLLISNYECSECHSWEQNASNYCPNCGADMRGEEHGQND